MQTLSFYADQKKCTFAIRYPETMLLPRLAHSFSLPGYTVRSVLLPNLLRNGMSSLFPRSMSCLRTNHDVRRRALFLSLSSLARSAKQSTILPLARPQQSRGMKTRSSVKRLCDGCKVGNLVIFVYSPYEELICVYYSRSEGRTESTLYGMCLTEASV